MARKKGTLLSFKTRRVQGGGFLVESTGLRPIQWDWCSRCEPDDGLARLVIGTREGRFTILGFSVMAYYLNNSDWSFTLLGLSIYRYSDWS